jgi:hypothetical protein
MRRPRIRLRTLMLAIALVTLLLWGAMTGARAYSYYRLATEYTYLERINREMAIQGRKDPATRRTIDAIYGPNIAKHYAVLARKYRRAMWRPWIAIAPEPPFFYPLPSP